MASVYLTQLQFSVRTVCVLCIRPLLEKFSVFYRVESPFSISMSEAHKYCFFFFFFFNFTVVWIALEIWTVFSHGKSHSVLVWSLSWYLVLGSQSSRARRDQARKVLEMLSIYHPDPHHLWVELAIYVVNLEKREVLLTHSVDRTLDRDFFP